MKTSFSLAYATAALLALAATGCSTPEKKIEPIVFEGATSYVPTTVNATADTVITADSTSFDVLAIRRFAAVNPQFSISLSLDVPRNNPKIAGEIENYVSSVISGFTDPEAAGTGPTGDNGSVAPVSLAQIVQFADSTVADFTGNILPKAIADSAVGTTASITVTPVFANKDYVTYAMYSSVYTGGANENSDFFLQTYDSRTGVPASFYTLVPADRQEAVRAELVARIALDKGETVAQYLKEANMFAGMPKGAEWTVKDFPLYHVGLTSQGYVFCYPKYSIGPGSDGVGVYAVPAE